MSANPLPFQSRALAGGTAERLLEIRCEYKKEWLDCWTTVSPDELFIHLGPYHETGPLSTLPVARKGRRNTTKAGGSQVLGEVPTTCKPNALPCRSWRPCKSHATPRACFLICKRRISMLRGWKGLWMLKNKQNQMKNKTRKTPHRQKALPLPTWRKSGLVVGRAGIWVQAWLGLYDEVKKPLCAHVPLLWSTAQQGLISSLPQSFSLYWASTRGCWVNLMT